MDWGEGHHNQAEDKNQEGRQAEEYQNQEVAEQGVGRLGPLGACTRLQPARRTGKLDAMVPARLEHLFWEYDVEKLGWPADRDLIIAKILERGRWDDIRWLRGKVSNEALSRWLLRSRGRGLSPQQIRYWQLVLDLPPDEVERWLSDPSRRIWHGRTRRSYSQSQSRSFRH